jgi:hypothetical protein
MSRRRANQATSYRPVRRGLYRQLLPARTRGAGAPRSVVGDDVDSEDADRAVLYRQQGVSIRIVVLLPAP